MDTNNICIEPRDFIGLTQAIKVNQDRIAIRLLKIDPYYCPLVRICMILQKEKTKNLLKSGVYINTNYT
jgi:hypothetical protein